MTENNEVMAKAGRYRAAWRRWLRSRWTVAVGLTLLAYTLGGFLLAPRLVKRSLPRYADQQLGHHLSLGQVRINPFLFTLEVKDFLLRDGTAEPLLAHRRFLVDFNLESIVRWAWTFADIAVEASTLHLVLDQTGRLNLDRLLERMPSQAGSARAAMIWNFTVPCSSTWWTLRLWPRKNCGIWQRRGGMR